MIVSNLFLRFLFPDQSDLSEDFELPHDDDRLPSLAEQLRRLILESKTGFFKLKLFLLDAIYLKMFSRKLYPWCVLLVTSKLRYEKFQGECKNFQFNYIFINNFYENFHERVLVLLPTFLPPHSIWLLNY